MSSYNRVVWSEGLFLQPQHLQQQDRYLERYVETRCHGLIAHAWGFTEVEIERDFLSIGKFGLRRAAGVFPDGTPFRMPEDDPLPAPIDIDVQMRDQLISLAVPLRRGGDLEVSRDGDGDRLARHQVREWQVRDATSSSGESTVVEVGALSTRLLPSAEATDAYAAVPLAHVLEARSDKRVILDDAFMPTVMHTRAATRLATVFILAARAEVPSEELRRSFPAQLKVGPVERIADLVRLGLPGVPVLPLPVAPRQIPFHAGFAYFELDQSNELWDQLRSSGGVALHVAGNFPSLAMEFWAIRT